MTYETLSALALYAFATSITPGPNNLMLMASGANFGLRRTLPHMLGIGLGFVVMIILVGLGLMGVFTAYPVTHDILLVLSLAYLLWLAWKTATAAPPEGGESKGQPLTFLQAAGFQWVNPKAWAMALTAITAYAPDRSITAVVLVAIVFGAINLPCVSSWTLMGHHFRAALKTPARLHAFNWTMAGLLILSMAPFLVA